MSTAMAPDDGQPRPRPTGAPPSPGGPSDPAPPRDQMAYPPLPPHVLERLAGYLGPGLKRQMALARESVPT